MGWPFRRRRFRDVVARQLAIFAGDHGDLVARARGSLQAYALEPDADAAQERYTEHDDLADEVESLLDDMYRGFSSALGEAVEGDYRAEFIRQARAAYGDLLPRLTFDPPEDRLP